MIRLIGTELFKMRKRLMTKVLLFVLIGIIIIMYLILLAVSNVTIPAHGPRVVGEIQNILGLPMAIPFALSLMSSLGAILSVILVASSIGNEYNWRTIRTVLICSESRFKLLAAKLIAAGIIIIIGMVIAVAAGFIMSLITTAIGGYAFNFDFATGSYLWDQFLQFWRTCFVLLPYILLGFLFAIVGRSVLPGIALGIAMLVIEPIIIAFMYLAGDWIAEIPNYLFTANVRAITSMSDLPQGFSAGMAAGGMFNNLPTSTHAFITLAIYSIACLVLAFYLFRKRDVTV